MFQTPAPQRPTPTTAPVPRILLCIVATCLLAAGAAGAEDWRYPVRRGDNLWTVAERYLAGRSDVERLRRLNQVREPRALPVGSVLRIPLAWMRRVAATAQLAVAQGDVAVETAGRTRPAAVGQTLGENDRLRTGPASHAALRLPDGSEVRVHADSEVVVETLAGYANADVYDSRLLVVRGRTESSAPVSRDAATRFDLRTRAGVTSVRGTEFRVASDAGDTSRTEVLHGVVAAYNDAGSVSVAAGFGTVLAPGRPPTPPTPLPEPPKLTVVPSAAPHLPAELEVTPVPGASAYRLEIARDRSFTALVLERVSPTPRFSFEGVDVGEYAVRVRAIGPDGIEGRDATMRIRVSPRPASGAAPSGRPPPA